MSTRKIKHLLFYFGSEDIYTWEIYLPFRLNVNDEIHMGLFFDRGALIEGGKEDDKLYHLLYNKEFFQIQSIIVDFDKVEIVKVIFK